MAPTDSTELHDRPLEVKLSVRPAGNGYDASNEVKAYRALGGAEEKSATPKVPSAASKRPAPKAAAAGKATPPWKR